MRQWFGDTEEHQADSHSGAEHHRNPTDGPELRFLTVLAEWNVSEPTDGEVDGEQHKSRRRENEEPADVDDEPVENAPRHRVQIVGGNEAPHENCQDRHCRYGKNHVIGSHTYSCEPIRRSVLVGTGILL